MSILNTMQTPHPSEPIKHGWIIFNCHIISKQLHESPNDTPIDSCKLTVVITEESTYNIRR